MGNRRLTLAALAIALAWPAATAAQDYSPPGISGFPPGYFVPCDTRPKTAVIVVPAPFDQYMRVVCAKITDALAPPPGFHWAFTNGTNGFLTALNANVATTGANFTRLANAPLTAAEVAAFRARLAPVVKNPMILTADIMRLEVDTSSNDHKQEYLLIAHNSSGAVTGLWGIECYNDCDPMEKTPWAFTVLQDGP
ncbi:MAG: hypothetical protein ACHP7N_07920 [Caulobacterales bacterium]